MKKIILFAIIYLIIGYILVKQKCKTSPVMNSNGNFTTCPPMTLSAIISAPLGLLDGLFTPMPTTIQNAPPIAPTTATDVTGTYWSANGNCYKGAGDLTGGVVVDNSECTSRGIVIKS